jgi:hypothetical protein
MPAGRDVRDAFNDVIDYTAVHHACQCALGACCC